MSRLVRCPRCSKLLVENSTVPLYQCGGCATVLRAKSYKPSGDNAITAPPTINSKQENQSESGVSDIGSASVNELILASTSSVNNGEERKMDPDYNPDHSIIDDKHNNDRELLETEREKIYNSSSLDLSNSTWESPLESEHHVADQTNQEDSNNEQVNMLLKADMRGSDYLKMTNGVGESSNSFSNSMASGEDLADTSHNNEIDDVLKSPATVISSHAYEGSISSDDLQTIHSPNWQLPRSRRTFRHQRLPKGKEQENPMGRNDMAAYNGSGHQMATRLSTSSNERHGIDVTRDESLLQYENGEHERGKSFDSTESQSVHNWTMEKQGSSSRSLERDSPFEGNTHNHMELLKKLDELRVQLTELYVKRSPGGIHDIQNFDRKSSPNLYHPQRPSHGQSPQQYHHIPEMHLPGYAQCTCLQCQREQQKFANRHQKGPYKNNSNEIGYHSSKEHDLEKSYLNERPKHHCRPVSGAAPFVICYNCVKLIKLPTDFLISKKKLLKLQCAACSEVLMLSFPDRSNSNPETPSRSGHSPTDIDSGRNGLTHHINDPQGYPISSFHDYGASLSKNYSSEPPLHISRKAHEKIVLKGKVPPQLHRLMGYGSASEILYQREDSDDGYESEMLVHHSHKSSNEIYASNKSAGSGRSTPQNEQIRNTSSPDSMEGRSRRSSRTRRAGLPRPGTLEDIG